MSKEELDKRSMKALLGIASAWYDQMYAGEIPSISLPTRTINIEYDDASEVWNTGIRRPAYCGKCKERDTPVKNGIRDRVCKAAVDRKPVRETLREMYLSLRAGNARSSVRRMRATFLSKTWRSSPKSRAKGSTSGRKRTVRVFMARCGSGSRPGAA